MNGPYKVDFDDGWWIVTGPSLDAPCPCSRRERAVAYADDKNREWNLAHHTARREAIEEAIGIVVKAANGRHPFVIESCNRIETALRALLGAGEKEKEADRGDE